MQFESVLRAYKEQVVNMQDEEGQRPLHTAAAEGKLAMAEMLIANGAKINAPDKQLWTPLHYACKEGYCVENTRRTHTHTASHSHAQLPHSDIRLTPFARQAPARG